MNFRILRIEKGRKVGDISVNPPVSHQVLLPPDGAMFSGLQILFCSSQRISFQSSGGLGGGERHWGDTYPSMQKWEGVLCISLLYRQTFEPTVSFLASHSPSYSKALVLTVPETSGCKRSSFSAFLLSADLEFICLEYAQSVIICTPLFKNMVHTHVCVCLYMLLLSFGPISLFQ